MGNLFGGYDVRLYRNNIAIPNDLPATPTNLRATAHSEYATLNWSAAHDAQTPPTGLTYNLRIGTTPGGSDVLAPMAAPSTGGRRVPHQGNAGARTSWTIRGLAPNTTYYWSVQAIDTAFAGSRFAQEHQFTTAAVAGFDMPATGVAEQNGAIVVRVVRNTTVGSLTVHYTTSDGSATAPADYAEVSGDIAWINGDTTAQIIIIPIIDDALNEADETIDLTLRVGGTAIATATLTIADDDPLPTMQIEQPSYTAHSSEGVATFTVALSAPSGRVVTSTYTIDTGAVTTAAPAEAITGTITFLPGETVRTVSVPIAGLEPGQTSLTITLHSANHATLGTTTTSVITIIDDRFRLYLPFVRR
jgi:hypothetical protein